ncbi:hypothetical protein CVT24_008806 [Panaeolus cyanescens]|uniref:Uncharacterized protein n=1 Tax=Panaeolus cyanescens TaxID=181874 RepID=A0A409WD09_9AGAR|nr:hypothetical protein CVT24_008806 [Panaeolus cyanescens]
MVNRGAFEGKRKEYLVSCKPDYVVAVEDGTLEDCLVKIHRGFFCIFPPQMPHDYEPTDEEVAAAREGENAEPSLPDREKLSESEYEVEMGRWKERKEVIKKTKSKITRWMAYQYLKDHNMLKKNLKGSDNAYASLMFQLAGKQLKKPRLRSPLSMWRRSEGIRASIERQARARCIAEKKLLKKHLAPIREEIANARFNSLSEEAREEWANQAESEHEAAVKEWKASRKNPLKTDPRSRQDCISNLPAIVQPLLDLVADATGWKLTLLAGGPCPARDGRMSMVSLHSGTTCGDVPMTFGQFESVRYRKYLTPMFANFLRNAYSVEECRERALVGDDADGEMVAFDGPDANGASFEVLPEQEGTTSSNNRPESSSEEHPDTHHTASGFQVPPPAQSNNNPRPGSTAQSPQSPQSRASSLCPDPPILPDEPPIPDQIHDQSGSSELPGSPPVAQLDSPHLTSCSPPPSPPPLPAASLPRSPPSSPPPSPPLSAPSPHHVSHAAPPQNSHPLSQPHNESSPQPPVPSTREPGPEPSSVALGATDKGRKRPAEPEVEAGRQRKSARVEPVTETVQQKPKVVGRKGKGRSKGKDTAVVAGAGSLAEERPRWFYDSMKAFTEGAVGLGTDGNGCLGNDWIALVEAWSTFQVAAGFTEDNKLPTKHRPFPIKEWIARARSPTYRPVITNLSEYESNFNLWWYSMQPDWRKADGMVDPRRVDGDWSSLWLPGLNGLVSVIAALLYWGIAAHGNKTRTLSWLRAVRDCKTAISALSL